MKESRYNFWFKTNDNKKAVYNTFTQALVLLDDIDIDCIHNLKNVDTYKKLGLLIEDNVNELDIIKYDIFKTNSNDGNAFRILTTTACNAKCPYCYEKGIKTETMTLDMADKVAKFIEQQSTMNAGITLEWFGGEPLVNPSVISVITRKLKNDGYIIKSAALTTNGILFTDELIEVAKTEWQLTNVQITLDGVNEIHDAVKGVEGCFAQVCDNIDRLAKNSIDVSVRMNVSLSNIAEIQKLIEFLAKRFISHEHIYFYLFPMFNEMEAAPRELMLNIIKLNKKLYDMRLIGKKVYHFYYHSAGCVHATRRGYTIAPNGNLYNCSHTINTGLTIGSVSDFSNYNPERLRFLQLTTDPKCEECVFLPICGSGCRVGALKQDQMYKCFIYKNVFTDVLKQAIDEEWDV